MVLAYTRELSPRMGLVGSSIAIAVPHMNCSGEPCDTCFEHVSRGVLLLQSVFFENTDSPHVASLQVSNVTVISL